MAACLVGTIITLEESEEVRRLGEGDALKNLISAVAEKRLFSQLPQHPRSDTLGSIVVDMLFHAALFCVDEDFSAEKTSALISILWRVFHVSMARSFTLPESLKLLDHHLVEHSVHRPPKSIQLFNLVDVKAAHQYVTLTFHRHYKLYHYCYTHPRKLDLESKAAGVHVQQPPAVVPLSRAKLVPETPPADVAPEADDLGGSAAEVEAGEAEQAADEEQPDAGAAEAMQSSLQASTEAVDALPHPAGLKQQLQQITQDVSTMSEEKLAILEAKLAELEARHQECKDKGSKGKKK